MADQYDLFASYAEADKAWVEGYLLDALASSGVRVHSESAFELGVPRLLQFEHAVQQSRRVLLVISKAYLAEGSAQLIDLLAQHYGLETSTWPVIPLVLEPVALPLHLRLLEGLDATNPENRQQVVERLCSDLNKTAPAPAPAPRPARPYPGLLPFSEDEANRFFGRDSEVQGLVQRLYQQRFLAVIGPSGSGKSSLVFAGLVPALRRSSLFGERTWLVRTLRPGPIPLKALADQLAGNIGELGLAVRAALAAEPPAGRLLFIVDQLEELFTYRSHETDEVDAFCKALLALAATPGCWVVLTARADFYAELMATPLWSAIQANRTEVLPLGPEALREAIVRPASAVKVFIAPELVDHLVADAGTEPGILPLVQETLVLMWDKLERRYLPESAYEDLVQTRQSDGTLATSSRSGLHVALALRADASVAALPPAQQAIARRIFVRLVHFGEGRADTRRQQTLGQLRSALDAPGVLEATVRALAEQRLLTLTGDESAEPRVDLAHEALIGAWPTLQHWLAERREAEQIRRRLDAKAQEWVRLGRGPGGLLDEVELLEAEHWLLSVEAAELGYEQTVADLAQASRLALRTQAARQRRQSYILSGAVAALTLAIIGALTLGLVGAQRDAETKALLATQQQQAAQTAQAFGDRQQELAAAEATARTTADLESARALRQAQLATSRQLAAQALSHLDQLDLGLLLSVSAYQVESTLEARASLLTILQYIPQLAAFFHRDQGQVVSVAISPDGQILAAGYGDTTISLWDVATRRLRGAPLRGHANQVASLAFSPDGTTLVSGGCAQVRIPSSCFNGEVRLWDVASGQQIGQQLPGQLGDVSSVAFSPDGLLLAAGTGGSTGAVVWNVATRDRVAEFPLQRSSDSYDWVDSVAFSPDSRTLAAGSEDMPPSRGAAVDTGLVMLWDIRSRGPIGEPLRPFNGRVTGLAFSPDGTTLAVGGGNSILVGLEGSDDVVQLWDVARGTRIGERLAGFKGHLASLVFEGDGRTLAAVGGDSVTLWSINTAGGAQGAAQGRTGPSFVEGRPRTLSIAGATSGAFTQHDKRLVIGRASGVVLFDLAVDQPLATTLPSPPLGAPIDRGGPPQPLLLSSDGSTVVFAQCSSRPNNNKCAQTQLQFVTVATGAVRQPPVVLQRESLPYSDVALSADGGRLAVAACAERPERKCNVQAWDSTSGQVDVDAPLPLGSISGLAISPDGRSIAATDRTAIVVWDLRAQQLRVVPFTMDDGVAALLFSGDGQRLAIGNQTRIRLFDIPSGRMLEPVLEATGVAASNVAVSPDGSTLAAGRVGQLALLDTQTAAFQALPLDAVGPVGYALAFGAQAKILATGACLDFFNFGCRRSEIRLWDPVAGQPIGPPFAGLTDEVQSLAFTSDGNTLVSINADVVRQWTVDPAAWVERACRLANRNLSMQEWQRYRPDESYEPVCDPSLPTPTSSQSAPPVPDMGGP